MTSDIKLAAACPKCGGVLFVRQGEDEFGTSELHWYATVSCGACDFEVRDFEDEFSDLGAFDAIEEAEKQTCP